MFRKTGTLLTAVLLGLTATVATAGPVAAAPADSVGGELSLSRLIFNPTERGYQGSVELTVTNTGSETDYLYYKMREPVPGAFKFRGSDCDSVDMRVEQNRRVANCSSPDYATLDPGESFRVTLGFQVLTNPRNYPMSMGGGWVELYSVEQDEPVAIKSFGALFRSTTGSLIHPRPYVQDTQPDAAIESVGPVTLDPEGSGMLLLPVTISYRGDAPHYSLDIKASPLPAGSLIHYTVPADGPVGSNQALVPGVQMMAGEVRSFGLLISPPTDPSDAQDVITLELLTNWYGGPDANPSDNTAQTTLAVSANS
ncbi:hypothetical protein AB0J84_13260 [Micromonospora arborensis]|uniref:hypothetical protein n=1 Tax=Micromonospora arborensis TaxID=2116518 RepID=UPI0034311F16